MNKFEILNYAIKVANGKAEIFHNCLCVTSCSVEDFLMFDTEEEMMQYITDNKLDLEGEQI